MASNSPGCSSLLKRKYSKEEADTTKPKCQYRKDCYRKNPVHFKEYYHPETEEKRHKLNNKKDPTRAPYFLTTVQGIDDHFNHPSISVSIEDILSDNSKELIQSVQFNYMFDIPWLIQKYPQSIRNKPLLIVHGLTGSDKVNLEAEAMQHSHIELVHAKLPIMYGTHHSKMMFLLYKRGLKVVIHTANLIQQDWYQKTQGVWVSPMFEIVSAGYAEEDDHFKADIVDYLTSYNSSKIMKWIMKIKQFDMKQANTHLIASVPGRHVGNAMNKWGHLKMRKILLKYGPNVLRVTKDWSVVGQFSSIGSLGSDSSNWLSSEWLESLSCCKGTKPVARGDLKLIYPTSENVRNSLEGYSGGGSLPFSVKTAMKQRYMRQYLCQWISNKVGRSLACPHIKTYTRLSPDEKSVAWFLLTSANLSKAAWGVYEKNRTQLMMRSYEIGVLLMPPNKEKEDLCFFSTTDSDCQERYIRLPYDVPLTPYSSEDKPWVWDIRYTKEDSHGRLWIPT